MLGFYYSGSLKNNECGIAFSKTGTATVTATYKNKTYTCKFTIKPEKIPAQQPITLNIGESYQFKLTTSASDISFSTCEDDILSVTSDGTVTAKKAGIAQVLLKLDRREVVYNFFVN